MDVGPVRDTVGPQCDTVDLTRCCTGRAAGKGRRAGKRHGRKRCQRQLGGDVDRQMSELDRVKEQLVYLRFWLGIMVATEDCFGRLAYLFGHRRKYNALVYGRIWR